MKESITKNNSGIVIGEAREYTESELKTKGLNEQWIHLTWSIATIVIVYLLARIWY